MAAQRVQPPKARLHKIKAGDVLWMTRRYKMGNTTMSTTGIYSVRVESVDLEAGKCRVQDPFCRGVVTWGRLQVEKCYTDKPRLVGGLTKRLATRRDLEREAGGA